MDAEQLIVRRLAAQLLSGPPAAGPVEVAERLLAIQAQDKRGFRLAVRVRMTGQSAAAVDRALSEERSLVVTWLNRGTLHLVRTEDYRWLHAVTTAKVGPANARRLAQTGVSPDMAERGVAVIVRALRDEGPLPPNDLRARLSAADVVTAGQAFVHLLFRASLDGLIVRGPVVDGEQRYALVADWLGPGPIVDRGAALAELARRYLRAHGPATERDLAAWAGIGISEARAGLRAIGGEVVGPAAGLLDVARPDDDQGVPPPKLLGPFDPLLHGWRDRAALLDGNATVVTTNGIFRPILLAGGRAVATWGLSAGRLRLTPFAPLSAPVQRAARREAAAIGDFLGLGPLVLVMDSPA